MKTPNTYELERAYKTLDEDAREVEYERVIEALKDTVEILNGFVRMSNRLPNY